MTGRFLFVVTFSTVVFFLTVLAWRVFSIYFNHSPSVEGLFFRQTEYRAEPGVLVFVCPDQAFVARFDLLTHADRSGPCGGTAPLLKRLVARAGDHALIDRTGVTVNEEFIAHSVPLERDGHGALLPTTTFSGVIPAGSALILGDHPGSFDSRYYGLIKEQWITGQAKRIF